MKIGKKHTNNSNANDSNYHLDAIEFLPFKHKPNYGFKGNYNNV